MNQEIQLAWQLVQNTGCNVFLTGKAGTGKTTFLREFCRKSHKRNVVLAPTGIAAINAQGSTLHSFFQLPFGPYIPGTDPRGGKERSYKFSERKRRLIRTLDLVIIDEISMVRPDLLDSVDAVLRRYRDRTRPFGGVQLLLIGDLQQLAPVAKPEEWAVLQNYYATPYFFSSLALREAGFVTVELKKVYRQSDQHFIDLLNKIRDNQADAAVLQELNQRYLPVFAPRPEEGYIRLTTHNWQADQINDRELEALTTEEHTYEAEIWKEFPELSYPTAQSLHLKVGAQVMFVKNDSSPAKAYFNGMIGRVVGLADSIVRVQPQDSDKVIEVTEEQWENTRYTMNDVTHEIEEELLGTFTQMPLKTAWAITVHKSQGLTFERAIIDVQYSFSHGQTYVALSRCKSLEGLVLSAPIPPRAIISDQSVVEFTRSIPEQVPTADRLRDMEREYFVSLLAELFTFHPLRNALDNYIRHVDEWFSRQLPDHIQEWKDAREAYAKDVEKVSVTFAQQYQRMIYAGYDYSSDAALQERCKKGAAWFAEHVREVRKLLASRTIRSGNKMVQERLVTIRTELEDQIRQKLEVLDYVEEHGFSVENYLYERSIAALPPQERKTKRAATRKGSVRPAKKQVAAREEVDEILDEIIASGNSYANEDLADYNAEYGD